MIKCENLSTLQDRDTSCRTCMIKMSLFKNDFLNTPVDMSPVRVIMSSVTPHS